MILAGVTAREKSLVALTTLVILGVVVVTMLIEPQLRAQRSQRAELRELRFQWAKMAGNVLVKNRIEDSYSKVESLMAGEGNDQQEISVFTRDLGELYSGRGVRAKSMKILPTQYEEYHRLLSIRVEIEGPISEIVRFILSVESHSKPLCIEQFVLKSQEIVDNVHGSFLITKVVRRPES